jgi:tyrosine-protein kinase Etk/Wzc
MNAPHRDPGLAAAVPIDTPVAETTLLDLALVIVEHWKTVVFVPLAVGLAALGLSFLITPEFTATARMLPPQQQSGASAMVAQQLGALAGLAGAATGLKNPADQYVAMLKSRTIADRLIERFKLVAVYESELTEDARRRLADKVSIVAGKDGLISIDVDDTDPARAAALANAYVEELRRLMRDLALEESTQRRGFFEERLRDARDKLARSEQALRASGVSGSTLKTEPRAAVEAVARIKAGITMAEVRLSAMRGFMSDGNPDLRQAQQEIVALRAQLAQAERSDIAGSQEGGEYIARFREFKYQEVLFELIARQYELARLDEARDGAIVQVVDEAVAPQRKSRPRKALIAVFATLATGVLTLAFLFGREMLRAAVRDPAAAARIARARRRLGSRS